MVKDKYQHIILSGEPLKADGPEPSRNPYNLEKKLRGLYATKNTYTICYFHCDRIKDLTDIQNETLIGEIKEGTLGGYGEIA